VARLKVLHVSMECVPWSKVGGMADVVGALPAALRARGCSASVLTPWYPQLHGPHGGKTIAEFDVDIGGWKHPVRLVRAARHVVLVDQPTAFDRPGVYADPITGEGWSDSLFCCLVLQQAARAAVRDGILPCDLVHCHDNHTGLLPTYLKDDGGPPSVYTIHNLAYQGRYAADRFALTGLDPSRFFGHAAFEFHGDFSLMKAGIVMADLVTTVSPGYAEEVVREEEGQGLDGVLRARGDRFVGILNGIDVKEWDPAKDKRLPHNFSVDDLEGRAKTRRALQDLAGLEVDDEAPLFGIVSRVTAQKGLDLIGPLLPWLVRAGAQVVMLGTGDPHILEVYRGAHGRWPHRVSLLERYDEEAARTIYGGSDYFCMPSRFEPCGLTQMYAMRYGAVPVVTSRGGLRDTVVPYTGEGSGGTGIVSTWATSDSYYGALDYALKLWAEEKQYAEAQRNGMERDFSWARSADTYLEHYRSLVGA
jgi:starch synthase